MHKLRLVAIAAMSTCALMLVGGAGVAGAQTTTPAKPLAKTEAITGTHGFKGTFAIDRFVRKSGKVYAVGTLTGRLHGKHVSKSNVKVPVKSLGSQAQTSQLTPTAGACQVLNLVLGPIDLNLLGLRVRTNQINLLIEAVPGAGNLLGNLLCGITNLINPSTLTPAQLTAVLNAILALL
jgi:hypothetical protein